MQLEMAADALRLPPWDAEIGMLSGGEKRRVALCKLLLSKPDMLLLDEPTNHLDAERVDWLEQFLLRFPGTVVGITHDRYFLDNAAEWILELDRGHGIPWKGNYSSWLDQKEARLEQERSRRRAQESDEEGTRVGRARTQRAGRPRARRAWRASTSCRVRIPEAQRDPGDLYPGGRAPGQRGDRVRERDKGLGDRLLIDNLSFSVPPGAIVGIIGPNGAGKSTLFQMITGKEQPDSGEDSDRQDGRIAFGGPDAAMTLPNDKTVFEEVSGGPTSSPSAGSKCRHAPTSAASTSRARDQQKIVGNLSGGERGRLHLAKTLLRAATCCCWTNRPTIWTWKPCARWKMRCWSSPAACW